MGSIFDLKVFFVVVAVMIHVELTYFCVTVLKRIVLFDTLMDQTQDDEILAILGHELGELFSVVLNFLCYASQDRTHEFVKQGIGKWDTP